MFGSLHNEVTLVAHNYMYNPLRVFDPCPFICHLLMLLFSAAFPVAALRRSRLIHKFPFRRRGNTIKYRRWSPKVGTKAAAMLVIVHGLHEHSGRWAEVAHSYTKKGYLVYANDHIGHGL